MLCRFPRTLSDQNVPGEISISYNNNDNLIIATTTKYIIIHLALTNANDTLNMASYSC
jgi:hypothetical protein